MALRALVLAAAACLLVGGCGESGDRAAEHTPAPTQAASTPAPGEGPACDALGLDGVMQGGEALDCTLDVAGTPRRYVLYVPERASGRPAPVLVALHGVGGPAANPEATVEASRLDAVADDEGFLLVLPEGLDGQWNDAGGGAEPDDVAFFETMLDAVGETQEIDPHKVYATGWSGGGFMVHRLACDAADRLTGIAVLHAPLRGECTPARPVSVLQVIGTADDVVPPAGGTTPDGNKTPRVDEAMKRWRDADGCRGWTQIERRPVQRLASGTCDGDARVALDRIPGGGHTWWSPREVAKADQVDVSARLWAFLADGGAR